MNVIYDLDQIGKLKFPAVITLGNFDGIHLGHRKIISRCIEEARKMNAKSIVVTYDHQGHQGDRREFISLTNEKVKIVKEMGIDTLIFIPFTEKIKNMQAHIFLQKLLIEKLNMQLIVLGYDHHFGKNREGNYTYLKSRMQDFHYEVIQIEPVYYMDRIISSSRIRSDLVIGDLKKVNDQLGSQYMVSGQIVRGFQRGQVTGFPTANIQVPEIKLLPMDGVYVGNIEMVSDDNVNLYPCVVNIGRNPTFNNEAKSVEAHILDFSGNLYGKSVYLFLAEKLRNEKKFSGIEDLKKQIQVDIEQARVILNV